MSEDDDDDDLPQGPPNPGPLTWATLLGIAVGLLGFYAALIAWGHHALGTVGH